MAGTEKTSGVKAVCFDFMGTCLDWHTAITRVLPQEISEEKRSRFALDWRQLYFDTNAARVRDGKAVEDIDVTHGRTLDVMLERNSEIAGLFTDGIKDQLVKAWHHQRAWDDVAEAVRRLKGRGYEVFVHANGTTRLQLDLIAHSGLRFDMLFSSELLGVYKPAPDNYLNTLKLIKREPEECVTVACHAYDLRGAKNVGMKTVYVYRWTDDIEEDQEALRKEFDAYLDNMKELDVAISSL